MPQTPSASHSRSQSLAKIPLWDSSDPHRDPPPLPLRPHGSASPITAGGHDMGYESPSSSRDVSPVRRESFGASLAHSSPSRGSATQSAGHKRNSTTAATTSVRQMHDMILHGGRPETSPTRGVTPTPRELFGSNTSFPVKDREILQPREQYSSLSFRKSLDFDKAPALPPIPLHRGTPAPDMNLPPPNSNALTHNNHIGDGSDIAGKVTVHDFAGLSSQLSGLTAIANSLQREMTNLSRRSKDNATDLMAIKEAAKNRDEEIRRSLRDLQNGMTSFEATDRLLEGRSHLSLVAPSTSSGSDRGSNYGDDALVNPKFAAASAQVLEKILREMSTREEQDHALELLQDIKTNLDASKTQLEHNDKQEKILSVLAEIRDREAASGKELALIGPKMENEEAAVVSLLEGLRQDIHRDKSGEEKIMSMLEEIREKEGDHRNDEKILSAIDGLKGKEGEEKWNAVISILEELRDRDVVTMLDEVRIKLDILSEDLGKASTNPRLSDTTPPPTPPDDDQVLSLLQDVKEGVDSGGDVGQHIKRLVEEWREIWSGHDKSVGDALKDLNGQIEVLAAVQRAALARFPNGPPNGLPSQALTTVNPPFPPDLDNEAAITALANIASTTTRTDITLSSINALIKVFQKETYASNTNNTEVLATLGRFLEEIGKAIGSTNAQAGDIRKVLEVVRTGVCSGNDKLAEFESNTARQIDELTHLHKHLHRSIMGDDDEALWKVDLGVKDDVEELSRKVDELFEKNATAIQSASDKSVEAINHSNPAEFIEELKNALGAMAQRSLDAFKNSEEAIQRLKEESTNSAEKNIEAIQNANPAAAIADFRTEVRVMAEKSLALCEAIDAKCGGDEVKEMLSTVKQELLDLVQSSSSTSSTEAADIKAAVDKLREELDAKMEDSLTTAVALASADEKTSAALADLKSEVAETLSKAMQKDDSERILEPIRDLRKEVMDLIERSNSALAAPVQYPEAEEIKVRIEVLATELSEAMEKTADLAAETAISNTDAGNQVKSTVEAIRQDIAAMGTQITEAVSSNSATAVEEGMKGAFEDLKESVLVKVEQGLVTTDKAVDCIAELSQQTRNSIEELKKEVMEMMEKSLTMAVATVKPRDSETENKTLLDSLEIKITDVIISTMAASTGSDEIKELIESLKSDIDGMGKQIALPTKTGDDAIHEVLEQMKRDIAQIVKTSASTTLTSGDTKNSMDALRQEVHDLMERNSSMIAPIEDETTAAVPPSATVEKIEEAIASLKEDVNEMVEKSLAAAIANSTFDSEESVKEAIEELKREVKDTLEKSMVPLPQQANHESSKMVREAMELLRQELATMFEKRAVGEAEDRQDMISRLDALKGQFAELLEKSTSVELKEAVDVLKIQVHGLLEISAGTEYAELKRMIAALNSQVVPRELTAVDDDVPVILEALRNQVEELAGKLADGDLKEALATLTSQVELLSGGSSTKVDTIEVLNAIGCLKSQIENLEPRPSSDETLRETVETLKSSVGEISQQASTEELKAAIKEATSQLSKVDDVIELRLLIEDFKKEFAESMEEHTNAIKGFDPITFAGDLKGLVEKSLDRSGSAPLSSPGQANETHVKEIKTIIEDLSKEVREMAEASRNMMGTPKSAPAPPEESPEAKDVKETIADVISDVGECRVEVAIVKELLEEKSTETSSGLYVLEKTVNESRTEAKESASNVAIAVTGIKEAVNRSRDGSQEAMAGIKEVVDGLQTASNGGFSTTATAITEFRTEAKEQVAEVKGVVDAIKEETRESFEEVNKTVEGAQVELKVAVGGVESRIDTVQTDIKEAVSEVKNTVGESNAEIKENFTTLTTYIEASQGETKEELGVVKKLVEESKATAESGHGKTQQQVAEVLGLVNGLQTEWKENQPTLSDALEEMKQLLLDAQKAASEKPEIEQPPPYDDSQTHEKLNQLIAGNIVHSKYLPQLDLLDTIQKQVTSASANITNFLEQQKSEARVDAAAKVDAARLAEIDLEKAITEKRLVEAATERLRDEHDKLQVSVEVLQEETEELRERKLNLAAELAGIETALTLRREELLMLESRGEALERRMLEGIIEQSRNYPGKTKGPRPDRNAALRKVNNQPSSIKTKLNAAGTPVNAERRHFSENKINDSPTTSKSGRTSLSGGGSIGLGQKEYSPSLGLLGRSQSVKYTSYSDGRRKGSLGKGTMSSGKEDLERDPILDEGAEYDGEYELESEGEGSVVRATAEDEEDYANAGSKMRSRAYPGLGLDFSDVHSIGSRSVSGVSSVA